jgi:hypothetical protein
MKRIDYSDWKTRLSRKLRALPLLEVHKMHCNDAKTNLLRSERFDIL